MIKWNVDYMMDSSNQYEVSSVQKVIQLLCQLIP